MEKKYTKIIISKFSEINKCFVADGVPLYVKPLKTIQLQDVKGHYFTSTIDFKSKSKFGWISVIEEFDVNMYINKYFKNKNISDLQLQTIKLMLNSIEKLPDKTPVAATYMLRGIENRRMELSIHKVFFYEV